MSITLVCGLRGSGKSTYVKDNLGADGLAYDMDAIASAFRLRMPHEEYHAEARRMANDFLSGFLLKAEEYTSRIYVIRTAPRVDEAEIIAPNRIVICAKRYVMREMDDADAAAKRIKTLQRWAQAMGITVETR